MAGGGVLLIGCGAMGGALLKGWLSRPALSGPFYVSTPRRASVAPFLGDPRVHFIEDLSTHTATPDVAVCAVKPNLVASVLPAYQRLMGSHTLFVSVAAGLPLSFYAPFVPRDTACVRVMPNLASAVGHGISLMCASRPLNPQEAGRLNELLEATGLVVPLANDDALEALTPLTGCGPAFLFRFMEALTRATTTLGVDEESAVRLTRALVTGCGVFLEASDKDVGRLREEVTSPKGMTWAGLEVMDAGDSLDTLVEKTLHASFKRAHHMRQSSGS